MDQIKELLLTHGDFSYRGEPVVTLMEREGVQVIEAPGAFFIRYGYFQFENDLLVGITLEMNQSQLDHHRFFRHFYEKYGRPGKMNPLVARWEDESTYLLLERPLTIKYLERQSIEEALEGQREEISIMEMSREAYIEQF